MSFISMMFYSIIIYIIVMLYDYPLYFPVFWFHAGLNVRGDHHRYWLPDAKGSGNTDV